MKNSTPAEAHSPRSRATCNLGSISGTGGGSPKSCGPRLDCKCDATDSRGHSTHPARRPIGTDVENAKPTLTLNGAFVPWLVGHGRAMPRVLARRRPCRAGEPTVARRIDGDPTRLALVCD